MSDPDEWKAALAVYENAVKEFADLEMAFVALCAAGIKPTQDERVALADARQKLALARMPILHRLLEAEDV